MPNYEMVADVEEDGAPPGTGVKGATITWEMDKRDGNGFVLIDTQVTGSTGSVTMNHTTTESPVDNRVTCTIKTGEVTNTNPYEVELSAAFPTGNAFFTVKSVEVIVIEPRSSWIWRYSFREGEGLKITFHKRGKPYFTCLYPWATQEDFDNMKNARSLGRFVRKRIYKTPYVEKPIEP